MIFYAINFNFAIYIPKSGHGILKITMLFFIVIKRKDEIEITMVGISIDKLAILVVFTGVSVYVLPDFLLLSWQHAAQAALCFSVAAFFCSAWHKPHSALFFLWLIFLVSALGYAHYQPRRLLVLAEQTAALSSKINTEFTIEQILRQQDYQRLVIRFRLHPDWPSQLAYADWRLSERVKIGQRWQGELQLRPLSSRLNQGGFDRQQWYFSKGISAWANIKSAVPIEAVFSWRQQRLNESLQQTEGLAQQGLLLALGFGERAWLPDSEWKRYQQTGTAHLIAISGLHIGLAMLFGILLLRMLQIFLPLKGITPLLPIIAGLLLAALYAYLAGFAVPTLRAVIALCVLYALRLQRFYCNTWRLFLRVAALLLLCDPLMVLSASFWLSFGAVACLILWYRVFPLHLIQWRGKPLPLYLRWLVALFHLQFGLLWLFTPIQLAVFGGFSLYGFWANLLIVPLFSFILVPLVLFAVLSGGVFYSWQAADWVADSISALLLYFQGGWVDVSEKTTFILTALLAVFLLLLIRRLYPASPQYVTPFLYKTRKISLKTDRTLSAKERNMISAGSVSVVVLCCGAVFISYVNPPVWRLETLDVGQGLATLIVKNGRGILYDTGAAWQGGSMAELEVIPYLRRQGIKLEHLILSHDDNDHAGGAQAVLARYPNTMLMTPSYKYYGSADVKNAVKNNRTFCRQGEKLQWQGLHFSILSPPQPVERAENPDSCVILIDDGRHQVLLTGDADTATENRFLNTLGKIAVLQVGHHGSKTSTGSRLVSQIRPDIALISSGRWNPWRFPHPDVVKRLEQINSKIYNTAFCGQISLWFYQDDIQVSTARCKLSAWYRRPIGEPGRINN